MVRGGGHAKYRKLQRQMWLLQQELDQVRSAQSAPGEGRVAGADAESPQRALHHPQRALHRPLDPEVRDGICRFPTRRSLTVGRMREAINRPGADPRMERRIASRFAVIRVDADTFLYNYTDSSTVNFLVGGRVGTGRVQQDSAALRRECRGLVLHRTGTVLVRPLHRLFNVDQPPETQMSAVQDRRAAVVTRKMDVCGVVIDGSVQLWTRSGPTAVGLEAYRVTAAAEADYVGFVKHAALHESTAVFEYIGRRSHKKAFEGNMHRVVLHAGSQISWQWRVLVG